MKQFSGFIFGAILGLGTLLVAQGRSGALVPGYHYGDCPGGPNTSLQFNADGVCGGSANLTWDGTQVHLTSNSGLSFAGTVNPITVSGGDDTEGDTALVVDNPLDGYVVLRMRQGTDVVSDSRIALWSNYPDYPATARVALEQDNTIQLVAGPSGSVSGASIYLHPSDGVLGGNASLSGSQVDITSRSNINLFNDGGGHVVMNDLMNTGSATGKHVVCVDTSTGQLYASSAGNSCAN